MKRYLTAVLTILALGAGVCGCEKRTTPPLPNPDLSTDPDVDPIPDPIVDSPDADTVIDTHVDTSSDTVEDGDAPALCPPDSAVGPECTDNEDCTTGVCIEEVTETFDGLIYSMWVGGYCLDGSWSSGCDPTDTMACGAGARCVHMGQVSCEDRWACMDACTTVDETGAPLGYNACCRPGYRCDELFSVCLPGCSNSRECCESWVDENGDTLREASEVVEQPGCTMTCSSETFTCIEGEADTFSAGCSSDGDCPAGGMCLTEGCPNPLGEPFVGGLCVGPHCDSESCLAAAGGCVSGLAGGLYGSLCLAACTTGLAPGDALSPCRDEYGCTPACGGFMGTAPAVADGYCWPAVISAAAEDTRYDPCTADDECFSPLGLGRCHTRAGLSLCSVACNARLAADHDACGAPALAGEMAPGLCWDHDCHCRRACADPSMALADGPCDAAGLEACYPLEDLPGEFSWSAMGLEPAGICLPACADPDDCEALFGIGYDCDVTSGRCSL